MTATRLVNLYLNRIKAYNGTCVEGAVDAATGLQLGDITPIANAGQLNAFTTLNLKEDKRIALGFPDKLKRTHTGPDDEKFADALDRARELDRHFARTGRFVSRDGITPLSFSRDRGGPSRTRPSSWKHLPDTIPRIR